MSFYVFGYADYEMYKHDINFMCSIHNAQLIIMYEYDRKVTMLNEIPYKCFNHEIATLLTADICIYVYDHNILYLATG